MCDSFYGLIERILEPDALAIPVAHDGGRKWISNSARHYLFPAYIEVSDNLFSNGILSTQGKDIILKEMKEEGGDELPFY